MNTVNYAKLWDAFWTKDRYLPSNGNNVSHPGATLNQIPTTARGRRRKERRRK